MSDKSSSYSEPSEALFAADQDMVLIPGYKKDDEALYYFIKDKNYLGATYVKKGLFGWKTDVLTWGALDLKVSSDNLIGHSGHGENLIYGLIKNGDERIIKMGDHEAKLLNLEMLPNSTVQEYQLQDMYIWYFESETALDRGEIKLLNKSTGEQLDSVAN
jgi:hypothetical protein